MGLFKKFNFGLKKTREQMSGAIDSVLEASAAIDDDLFEELEEILIMGDVGVTTAQHIIDELRDRVKKRDLKKPDKLRRVIREVVADMLSGKEGWSLIRSHL